MKRMEKMLMSIRVVSVVFLMLSIFVLGAAASRELYVLPSGAISPSGGITPDALLLAVDVNGNPQVSNVSSGGNVTVSASYSVADVPAAPTDIWQLFFIYSWTPSWPPPSGYYAPIYDGVPGLAPGVTGTENFTLVAPATNGSYYLWFCFNELSDMQDAVNAFRTPMTLPAHAQIVVGSPSPPSLSLTPTAGFSTTTVTGSGFSINSEITITWDGMIIPAVPSPVITNEFGNFSALISVPTQTVPGAHTVNATDQFGNFATATFTVVNMTGPQGPKGDTGAQGSKGDTGATGPQGPAASLGDILLVLIAISTAASIFALCIAVVALLRRKT